MMRGKRIIRRCLSMWFLLLTAEVSMAGMSEGGVPGGDVLQGNPIITDAYTADPSAHVFNDTLWVYPSHDRDDALTFSMEDYHVYSTTDMVEWKDWGVIFSPFTQTTWAKEAAWAPDCIERNGKYYLYYPTDKRHIGVAVGDTPHGPFHDPLGHPLISIDTPGVVCNRDFIDPCVFIDDDGQAYLFMGQNTVCVVKLNDDMISYSKDGGDHGVYIIEGAYEFFEAAWVHKRDGVYYLSYSDGTTSSHKPRIAYCTAGHPLGPYTYRGVILGEVNSGTNHHSIVNYKGRDYLFYHTADISRYKAPGFHCGVRRNVCVDDLRYNADGSIRTVVPTINMEKVHSNTIPQHDKVVNIEIRPGERWPDSDGNHIQAHGGGMVHFGDKYYWYGEERRRAATMDTLYRYVSCYSSSDLMNWKFEGDVLKLSKPDSILTDSVPGKRWVLERPKVYYNASTGKYVMYMHIDGTRNGTTKGYNYAHVGVAVSDSPTGPFTFLRTFRPLGKESRDIGQFIDDDGSAYLIFESRPEKGFYIARLSDDYLDVADSTCFIHSRLEGGAIVKYDGLYYCIGSGLTGWKPNPNKYATATTLAGPWSDFRDIAPPETNTYSSQSTMLFKVEGTETTTVIFMADQWRPAEQWESRYLWMPLDIGGGELRLPQPKPWKIDVKTGRCCE